MSWTTDLQRAMWFAERNLGDGPGNVYTICRPTPMATGLHRRWQPRGTEFVMDPDYLNDEAARRIPSSAGMRDNLSLTSVEPTSISSV